MMTILWWPSLRTRWMSCSCFVETLSSSREREGRKQSVCSHIVHPILQYYCMQYTLQPNYTLSFSECWQYSLLLLSVLPVHVLFLHVLHIGVVCSHVHVLCVCVCVYLYVYGLRCVWSGVCVCVCVYSLVILCTCAGVYRVE